MGNRGDALPGGIGLSAGVDEGLSELGCDCGLGWQVGAGPVGRRWRSRATFSFLYLKKLKF
jgi:hypothetical protein